MKDSTKVQKIKDDIWNAKKTREQGLGTKDKAFPS